MEFLVGLGRVIFITLALGLSTFAANAGDYPDKPVRIITGAPAGGSADLVARVIGAKLTQMWGQQIVVQNMPGASGVVAFDYIAKSPPDGYTVMIAHDALSQVPFITKKLPYDTLKDFAPIDLVARTPLVLVVRPTLPVSSIADLIALAKSKPSELTYAEFGAPTWFPAEMLSEMGGVQLTRIPYKERSAATVDVVAGRADVMFCSLVSILPYIQNGTVKAIAMAGKARSPSLPNVPSISETPGFENFEFTSWLGFMAPAGTPQAIVDKFNADVGKVVAMADVQKQLSKQLDLINTPPSELSSIIKADLDRWSKLKLQQ